jgi:hypothetical protein
LQGDKNQEPAAGGPAGSSIAQPEEKTPETEGPTQDIAPVSLPGSTAEVSPTAAAERPAARTTVELPSGPPARPAPAPGKPDLRHILPEDLADTGRLLELYAQAVTLGLVPASEWGRLRFVAAAEHARSIGMKNPCGLFARLVRAGTLHYATEGDEASASVRLRRHLYGGQPAGCRPPEQGVIVRRGPELSEDARLVRAVRAAAAKAGYRCDPFPLLKREKPEWTRERWDRAVAELYG